MEVRAPKPAKGPLINDVIYVVICLVVFVAIAELHKWLGYAVLG